MKWPRLRDIFAFGQPADAALQLPVDDGSFSAARSGADAPADPEKSRWQKVRFDNTIRLWVAIPTFLTCLALWLGGSIAEFQPVAFVFTAYVGCLAAGLTLLLNIRLNTWGDMFLSGLDLLAMSCAIYYTGGVASPLYFVYFVPLIVHAFHRDWALILFNGFGGVVLYAAAVVLTLSEMGPAAFTDLAARLVFMLLTVAVGCLALNLLRQRERQDRSRIERLRAVSALMHRLNRVSAKKDLGPLVEEMAPVLAVALGGERPVEFRALLRSDGGTLREGGNTASYAVPIGTCPVIADAKCVMNDPSDASLECHWEAPALARLCLPIAISEGEVFGVLSIGSSEEGAFTEDEQKFARFVAHSIALCAHRLQRMEELRRTVEMGSCITAAYLGSTHSKTTALRAVVEGALTLIEAEQSAIYMPNKITGRLEAVFVRGERAVDERGATFGVGEGIVGWVYERCEPRWTANVQDDVVFRARRGGIKSLLAVPLRTIKGDVIGVLTISRLLSPAPFGEEDIAVAATYAHRVTHALQLSQSNEQSWEQDEPPQAMAA